MNWWIWLARKKFQSSWLLFFIRIGYIVKKLSVSWAWFYFNELLMGFRMGPGYQTSRNLHAFLPAAWFLGSYLICELTPTSYQSPIWYTINPTLPRLSCASASARGCALTIPDSGQFHGCPPQFNSCETDLIGQLDKGQVRFTTAIQSAAAQGFRVPGSIALIQVGKWGSGNRLILETPHFSFQN